MTCTRPKAAWATTDVDKEGREYKTITFRAKGPAHEADFQIPCGKCVGCHAERRRDWGIRMFHESQYYAQNSFLTLTYEDDNQVDLDKTHLDQFLARLRKKHKTRYFICGEYGEKTHRPHYHAIIFGNDFRNSRYTYAITDELYGNKDLERTWSHGNIAIGDFTAATAMYTAGYVGKKLGEGKQEGFTIMSRKPPIGWRWAMENQDQMNRLGHVVVDGRTWPIPKAYFKWADLSKARPAEVDLETAKDKRSLNATSLWEQELRSKEINLNAAKAFKSEKL